MERYSRQMRFHGIGEEGQRKLMAAKVAVIGCGGLGSVLIELLARAGIGELVIVDRDLVELSNLQRQILYSEADASAGLPKAVAAAQAIQRINSSIKVQHFVTDISGANIESIIDGCTVVLDGTDNLETRYVINDACVKLLIPWVYGGAVASSGMSMTILPHDTACLRCVFPASPPPGSVGTCETEGVLASIIAMVASIQVAEATKVIIGESERLNRGMIYLDVWTNDYQSVQSLARNPECPCCGKRQYEYLDAQATSRTTSLCGRNAVQVSPPLGRTLNLTQLGQRLKSAGQVTVNDYLLRFVEGPHEITIFADGRAIIKGTNDEAVARSLYARYVGT